MRLEYTEWAAFKADCLAKKNGNLQARVFDPGVRTVMIFEGPVVWAIRLAIGSADDDDFLANYAAVANYASATVPSPFAADDYVAAHDRIPKTVVDCAPGGFFDLWYEVPGANIYMNGGDLFGENITLGDWLEMGIASPAADPAERVIVKEWIKGWNLCPGVRCSIETPYAGHPPAGYFVRIRYHRDAAAPATPKPVVCINLNLHAQEI